MTHGRGPKAEFGASMLWDGKTVTEVVESYQTFLKKRYACHYEFFRKRRKANPEGALAEAITFSFLRSHNLHPAPFEDPSKGGVDFRCAPKDRHEFVVEVRALDSEAVTRKSGLQNTSQQDGGSAFSIITNKLLQAAVHKAAQMAHYRSARILMIGSSHDKADLLLGRYAAGNLLLSDETIAIPIQEQESKSPTTIRRLRNSVFFRFDETLKVMPCRQSISVIMLVAILVHQSQVVGILHPEPSFSFDIRNFPTVPFLRVSNWPITTSTLAAEWIPPNSQFAAFPHQTIADEGSTP